MVRKCSVPDCLSDSNRSEDAGVTFHRVPVHPDIRPQWLELCRITDTDRKAHFVCSRHFLKADFCTYKGGKYMLKQGTVPSVFPWHKSKPKTKIIVDGNPAKVIKEKRNKVKKSVSKSADNNPEVSAKEQPLKIDNEVKTKSATEEKQDEVKEGNVAVVEPNPAVTTEEPKITGSESNGKYTPNTKVEVLDFNQTWSLATIVEVDYEENEVLVHFDSHSNKHDEWIGTNSSSLRLFGSAEKDEKEKDIVQQNRAELVDSTPTALVNSSELSTIETEDANHKPGLFEPARGSKKDRHLGKRKLDIASLFNMRKRQKHDDLETQCKEKTQKAIIDINIRNENVEGKYDLWFPSWDEHGLPIGVSSELQLVDGIHKTIAIPDPRLPPGWKRHMLYKSVGNNKMKWDSIIVNEEGRRFRRKSDVFKYLTDHPDCGFHESQFEFAVFPNKSNKRPSVYAAMSPSTTMTLKEKTSELDSSAFNEDSEIDVVETPKKSNLLAIPEVDGGFKCPIEGCGKNFRRENLAQMHVKHYHPEYTQYLDLDNLNVADLAYARTVNDTLEKSPSVQVSEKKPKIKTPRLMGLNKAKPEAGKGDAHLPKDSEIIKLLGRPFEGIISADHSTDEPIPSGLSPSNYPEIKLKDLLQSSTPSGIPKPYIQSSGLKTLLPVKREIKEEIVEKPETVSLHPDTIIEGGEVIKIVRMKQEEIINCTCGITEEDGLMIQCELCLCWQHAYCNNIQRENEVPDKYVCYICQHPARQRNSKKYMHDQDWLKHGTLPTASYHCKDEAAQNKRFEGLKISHDISGGLIELKGFINALQRKIKIAKEKDHPKLYLWSKQWEKEPLPETVENHQTNHINKQPVNASEMNGDDKYEMMEAGAPQPEAAIDSADCKLNLLDHIMHCQSLVQQRLDNFTKQMNELDDLSGDDDDEVYAKLRQTTSMLVRDAGILKELSQIPTF